MSKSRGSRDPPLPLPGGAHVGDLDTLEIRGRREQNCALGRLRIACEQLQQLYIRTMCARGLSLAESLVSAGAERQCRSMQRGDALNELPLQDVSGISYGESSSRTQGRLRHVNDGANAP